MSKVLKKHVINHSVNVPDELLPLLRELTGKKNDVDAFEHTTFVAVDNFINPQEFINALSKLQKKNLKLKKEFTL